jgi:hypothetical protein
MRIDKLDFFQPRHQILEARSGVCEGFSLGISIENRTNIKSFLGNVDSNDMFLYNLPPRGKMVRPTL